MAHISSFTPIYVQTVTEPEPSSARNVGSTGAAYGPHAAALLSRQVESISPLESELDVVRVGDMSTVDQASQAPVTHAQTLPGPLLLSTVILTHSSDAPGIDGSFRHLGLHLGRRPRPQTRPLARHPLRALPEEGCSGIAHVPSDVARKLRAGRCSCRTEQLGRRSLTRTPGSSS